MSAKRWVRVWVIMIMMIPMIAIFNYFIDPYGYFDKENKFTETITRVNKPLVANTKLYTNSDIYLVGSSRQRRVYPQLIEKYTGKKVQNINIASSTLTEDFMLAKRVKELGKNFIDGFDCFGLNYYRMENFKHIKNRYLSYKKELENRDNVVLKSLFNMDTLSQSIKYLFKYYITNKKINQREIDDNSLISTFDKEFVTSGFHNIRGKTHYINYKLYPDKDIVKFAKIADKNDIFIIYPKYVYYYKMFQKYENIEAQYFRAIKLLVKNTNAKVYIFYGVTNITKDLNNFDKNGWHFRPKIAKDIYDDVYLGYNKNSTLITKNSVDKVLDRLHKEVYEYIFE